MKRRTTKLEERLINEGWYLELKRYCGKDSKNTLCYEYCKTADLKHDNKSFEQFIRLNKKRSHIVKYGIKNLVLGELNEETMTFVRELYLVLKENVRRFVEGDNQNANL